MPRPDKDDNILTAEIILPAPDLQESIDFFTTQLGFRLDAIIPADSPVSARLSGHGLRLRLDKTFSGSPGALRMGMAGAGEKPAVTAPNGTRIEFGPARQTLHIPTLKPRLHIERLPEGASTWQTGRAGMLYRDLIPGRLGGRFIASHIRITTGGPVPDNVHYHDIRFQMIYCYKGWVRLVYEDQGEPFVMQAGDCVLQPPMIRHRVLESSDGLEVIEIGCPAEHVTYLDHDMDLPTRQHLPERDFNGQRYVFHVDQAVSWQADSTASYEMKDLGIGEATGHLAGARVIKLKNESEMPESSVQHDKEFAFWFVLQGGMTVRLQDHPDAVLSAGDALVIPAGMSYQFTQAAEELELLEVVLPA